MRCEDLGKGNSGSGVREMSLEGRGEISRWYRKCEVTGSAANDGAELKDFADPKNHFSSTPTPHHTTTQKILSQMLPLSLSHPNPNPNSLN
jgi:hypothetical protein